MRRFNIPTFREIARRAARRRALGEALDAIDRAGLDNIGLITDILHLDRSGGTPSDLAQVDPSRIFIAQICDAPAERPRDREGLLQEARYGRQYPGDGALPLRRFIEALPPGCEVEAELPIVESTNLPPLLKAQIARCRTERFFLDTIVASFVSRRQTS